jgi:hypothetical protein
MVNARASRPASIEFDRLTFSQITRRRDLRTRISNHPTVETRGPTFRPQLQAFACKRSLRRLVEGSIPSLEFGDRKSAACGWRPRRAYRPYRRCGRVAEGGGLLNRYRVVKPYRGFESLRLRQRDCQTTDIVILYPGPCFCTGMCTPSTELDGLVFDHWRSA